jgi:predicted dehydrogenase
MSKGANSKMLNVGIIGCGYWGPNLIRNFNENPSTRIAYICDIDDQRLRSFKIKYPLTKLTVDYRKMLSDDSVDIVAIATPVSTHYKLASDAIKAGKHVLVEKPMTARVSDAVRLVDLAEKMNVKLFVDHTFIYTDAVKKIKNFMASGEIGDIYYFDSVRVNLGLFQHDVNVIWDLAPHDFSVMDYLIEEKPECVSAVGSGRVHHSMEDIAYVTVKFKSGLIAHFHVNWMSPVKIRKIIIGGSNKMVVFDDLSSDEKVKVYDKGVKLLDAPKDKIYKSLVEYRIGDMYAPKIETVEALKIEVSHIADCIKNNKKPLTDGYAGLNVVRLLEAAQKSLAKNGAFVKL